MKEEITSKKKNKSNVTVKGKKTLLLFCFIDFEQFFFPWLIVNHKHKCIQAKIFETQVSWCLDSYTH